MITKSDTDTPYDVMVVLTARHLIRFVGLPSGDKTRIGDVVKAILADLDQSGFKIVPKD